MTIVSGCRRLCGQIWTANLNPSRESFHWFETVCGIEHSGRDVSVSFPYTSSIGRAKSPLWIKFVVRSSRVKQSEVSHCNFSRLDPTIPSGLRLTAFWTLLKISVGYL